jgi:transcription initiation factor TFIIE subunit alpha
MLVCPLSEAQGFFFGMSKSEQIGVVQDLLHFVSRAFYEHKEIIVMDILLQNDCVRDDQLASALGLNIKDLQKVCGTLNRAGLLKVKARWEELNPNEVRKEYREKRKISRSYYYIDYPRAINVIKLKIYKIGKLIDKEVNKNVTQMPFKCTDNNCLQEYSALDMLDLEMTDNQIPLCRYCMNELELCEPDKDTMGNAQYVKFMNESKIILDFLKKTEDFVLDESDPVLPDINTPVDSVELTPTPVFDVVDNVVVEIESEQIEVEREKNGIWLLIRIE